MEDASFLKVVAGTRGELTVGCGIGQDAITPAPSGRDAWSSVNK